MSEGAMKYCEENHYFNGTLNSCLPCKLCVNMIVESKCDSTHNTECGDCLPGFSQTLQEVDSCTDCNQLPSLFPGCQFSTNLPNDFFKNSTRLNELDEIEHITEVTNSINSENPFISLYVISGVTVSLLMLLVFIVLLVHFKKKRQRENREQQVENGESEDSTTMSRPNLLGSTENVINNDSEPCIEIISEAAGVKVVYKKQSEPYTRNHETLPSIPPVRSASCSSINCSPARPLENIGNRDYSVIQNQEVSISDSTSKGNTIHSVFQFVAKKLTNKNWKIVGRKLRLEENHLCTIESDYLGDLEEQKYQMLLKWQAISKEQEVTTKTLIQALRCTDLQYLADKIQQMFPSSIQGATDNRYNGFSLPQNQCVHPQSDFDDEDNEELDETRPLLPNKLLKRTKCRPPLLRSQSAPART